MCGIVGVLDFADRRLPEQNLKAALNAIRHRGPDDEGTFISGPLTFGFRRLSIVDLARGHQPMSNEDGTLWIVFNGEIYNHPELRPILEKRGHRYATNSDTETILHLYEEYGDDCVHHLRGMFAFAIWDAPRKRLFGARDRLGIKPLYYAINQGRFAFASEIKSLLEVPGIQPLLNRRVLPEFFAFGYLSSEETLFEGISKLLPGNRFSIDVNEKAAKLRISQYWDVDVSPANNELSEDDYVAEFSELFEETVKLHLMSDVPLGVFLSGGIDSSSIAAVVAKLRRNAIQTFSVGYADDAYSELPYARQVARHVGAEHNEVTLGPDDFLSTLPKMIWHEDEPVVWPSSIALYYVSCLARTKVKVVLTGEGADEILAGYLKYRATLLNLRLGPLYRNMAPRFVQELGQKLPESGLLPDWIRRKLRHSFLYYPTDFAKIYFDNFYSVFAHDQQPQLFSPELNEELRDADPYASAMRFYPAGTLQAEMLNRLLYLDIKTYLVELLMKQDQMSMAASIESRVPFLDHRLLEWTARVPPRFKVRGTSGKYLLRRAMASRLPGQVLRRHKKGFPTPIRPWLRNQLFDKLSAILTDGRMAERRLVKPEHVESLLAAHRQGFSDATERCWRLLNFELWNRIFVDGDRKLLESPLIPRANSVQAA
jgi:asparagine synthase (glutamine-hydrolysing)